MNLQIFLNDLSVPDEACTTAVAVERLQAFIGILRAAARLHRNCVINSGCPLAEMSLGRDRPLAALRNDPSCVEERAYLKTVVNRSPWNLSLTERVPDPAGGAEYRMPLHAPIHSGSEAVALGLSHDLSGLAVSLPTHDHWKEPIVEVVRTTLDVNANQVDELVNARNASCPDHVDRHSDALSSILAPVVESGAELWERRTELVPNLRWVPTARWQLESLQRGDPNLKGALDRLIELDEAIRIWRESGAPHPIYPFSVTPESRRRLNDGLCDIRDENGSLLRFSDHVRYGPDENRLHFILQTEPDRHALVGHIGRKLGIG